MRDTSVAKYWNTDCTLDVPSLTCWGWQFIFGKGEGKRKGRQSVCVWGGGDKRIHPNEKLLYTYL